MENNDLRFAARVISFGIIFAILYFASSVIMTLMLGGLLSYFLDPVVEFLEDDGAFRRGRSARSLFFWRSRRCSAGWVFWWLTAPTSSRQRGRVKLHAPPSQIRCKQQANHIENQVDETPPAGENAHPPSGIAGGQSITDFLIAGVGSLYSILLVAAFLPFLVFFMLAAKPQIWKATMELFHISKRTRVKEALDQVSSMLRGYLVGNALVALILMVASWGFFSDDPSGLSLSRGCYFRPAQSGTVSRRRPLLAASFLDRLDEVEYGGPFCGHRGDLFLLHLIGFNVLMPAIVGRRVHLNPLAVTIALLIWGWLWGTIGLILAIPITATLKVVCDHVDGWEPVGRWLGA